MGVYSSFTPRRYCAFIPKPYFESGRGCKQWYDDVDVKDSHTGFLGSSHHWEFFLLCPVDSAKRNSNIYKTELIWVLIMKPCGNLKCTPLADIWGWVGVHSSVVMRAAVPTRALPALLLSLQRAAAWASGVCHPHVSPAARIHQYRVGLGLCSTPKMWQSRVAAKIGAAH